MRSRIRVMVAGALVAGGCWLSAGARAAEPSREAEAAPLAAAEARYEQADFEGALDLLARAEASGLTRDELVQVSSLRALIHFALGEEEAMRQSLQVLAVLEPAHVLGRRAPPAVRRAWEEVRDSVEPLQLDMSVVPQPHGVRVEARTGGEALGLVRSVHLAGRVGDGPWLETDTHSLDLPAAEGDLVSYYATLVGPGGAVLAERGTPAVPLRWRIAGAEGFAGIEPWIWGLAGVVVGTAGTLLVLWLTHDDEPDATMLPRPQLQW